MGNKEQIYTGFLLKKQPLGEADEIVTFYTREAGKVRGLAKSVRRPQSKLQNSLQPLFLLRFGLAGKNLPKIISAEVLKTNAELRNNLLVLKWAFYGVELTLRFSADEQPNMQLFESLEKYLDFLGKGGLEDQMAVLGAIKFQMDFLKVSGVPLQMEESPEQVVFFSRMGGGFVGQRLPDSQVLQRQELKLARQVAAADFSGLRTATEIGAAESLQKELNSLIEYHMERQVKSQTVNF